MIVKLKYLGLVVDNLPTSMELEDGASLAELIKKMKIQSGEETIDAIFKKSTLLVNKSKIDENTILKDGDEVMVLSVLGGG